MKTRDEMITDLLEMIDTMTEAVEDMRVIESDFTLVTPILEQLRDEVSELS